jgi:hypothetical protein
VDIPATFDRVELIDLPNKGAYTRGRQKFHMMLPHLYECLLEIDQKRERGPP